MSNDLFTLGTQQSSDPLFYEISDTLEDEEEKLLNEKSDWKPSNDALAKKNETFAKEKVLIKRPKETLKKFHFCSFS